MSSLAYHGPFLDEEGLAESAAILADLIWDHRINTKDRGISWLGPRRKSINEAATTAVIGPHLYGGSTGIAFFFAALAYLSGDCRYSAKSLLILDPLRTRLAAIVADPARARASRLGIGGLVGLGGLLYSFFRIGQWLGDDNLLSEVEALLSLLTPERILADEVHDVVIGSAGAILALLTLSSSPLLSQAARSSALDSAARCGTHLINKSVRQDDRSSAWYTIPGHLPLTGFAHGTAGISCALLRLHQAVADPAFLAAANRGLAYERRFYSPDERNWRDLRFPSGCMVAWCHGAPGIALGRLATRHIDHETKPRETTVALQTTKQLGLVDIDNICCGNMGRAEILLYAYTLTGESSLLAAAQDIALRTLTRAGSGNNFLWVVDQSEHTPFDPALFTGAAGIGYTLLRFAYPTRLPSVLLLD